MILGFHEPLDDGKVSHGICSDCSKQLEELGVVKDVRQEKPQKEEPKKEGSGR